MNVRSVIQSSNIKIVNRDLLASIGIILLTALCIAPTLSWQEFSNSPENLVIATAQEIRRGGSWLVRLIEQSGARVTPGVVLVIALLSAAASAFVLAALVRHPLAAPLGMVAGLAAPFMWLLRRRSARLRRSWRPSLWGLFGLRIHFSK